MSSKIAILGAGGFAREVLDAAEACAAAGADLEVLGFVVDPQYGSPMTIVNEKPILGGFDWLERNVNRIETVCGVGSPEVRAKLVDRAAAIGARFCNIIHPNAVLTRWIEFGSGVVITAGCILTNQIVLGDHVQINLDCTIGHNATLEDFATLAPGVHVSGYVTLGKGAYIGTGANIIDRVKVGEWSIVGAGSTVVRDIPPNTTAVGVPARVVKEHGPSRDSS